MKVSKKTKIAVIGFISGFGSVGIGMNAYNDSGKTNTTPEQAVLNYGNAEAHQFDAQNSLQVAEQEVGRVCLLAIGPYREYGKLAQTKDDSAVSDLVGNAEKPCGTTPTEARINLWTIRSAEDSIRDANNQVVATKQDLGWAIEDDRRKFAGDTVLDLELAGGALSVAGVLVWPKVNEQIIRRNIVSGFEAHLKEEVSK